MAPRPPAVLRGATPEQVGGRARTVEGARPGEGDTITVEGARPGEGDTITVEAAACVAESRDCWLLSRDRRRAGRLFCEGNNQV